MTISRILKIDYQSKFGINTWYRTIIVDNKDGTFSENSDGQSDRLYQILIDDGWNPESGVILTLE